MLFRREWQDWEVRRIGAIQTWYLEKRKARAAAPLPVVRTLNGDRKANLVNAAFSVLKDWRSSPFEFEGAVRHGIRSALCLERWSWGDADHASCKTVEAALSLLGAERPTWHQGQPEARDRDPRYGGYCRCINCGDLIDPDEGSRTCSRHCTRIANQKTYYQARHAEILAASRLRYALNPDQYRAKGRRDYFRSKELGELRDCAHCGKQFPGREGKDRETRFCSRECFWESRRIYRSCAGCNTLFKLRAKGVAQRFCSKDCWNRSRKVGAEGASY